ncbi:MAG: type II secretion system protein [Candidatus Liptonbacteria bacterium]|nr:type II secretion system protein [Candidatus Liptonbacteria bacterium]
MRFFCAHPVSNGIKNRGFVLIELIVALGIFSIIMAITAGGFVRFLKTQRQTSAFAFVNNTLGVVLEQMAKEIRTGKNFSINSASCLSFVNSKNANVAYYPENSIIKRGQNCSSGQGITGNKIFVGYLTFIVSNNQSGSSYPPRITILIGANPNNEYAPIYTVNLQTTVSSRRLGG